MGLSPLFSLQVIVNSNVEWNGREEAKNGKKWQIRSTDQMTPPSSVRGGRRRFSMEIGQHRQIGAPKVNNQVKNKLQRLQWCAVL